MKFVKNSQRDGISHFLLAGTLYICASQFFYVNQRFVGITSKFFVVRY